MEGEASMDYTQVLQELERLYPDATPELHFSNPYETLVATMLSAQCTDKQVNKVTAVLFPAVPDVYAMAGLTADELRPMIKSCGFKSKADNITAACRIIVEQYDGKVPQTMDGLTSLPGVGRKTANVVLANAFGVPTIAVDTHVFRVSNRLGLASAKDVYKTELRLMEIIPKEKWIQAHHWLIYHGRRVCFAIKPMCGECTLARWCRKHLSEQNAYDD